MISVASMIGYALTAAVCAALPAGGCVWACGKRRRALKPFVLGAACLVVYKYLLRPLFGKYVLNRLLSSGAVMWLLDYGAVGYVYALALFGALAVWLLCRLCAGAPLCRELGFDAAVAFGLGHSGLSALTGIRAPLSSLGYCIVINRGTLASLLPGMAAAEAEVASQMTARLTPVSAFAGAWGYFTAAALSVSLAVMVFRGAALRRSGRHLALAVTFAFAFNAAPTLIMSSISDGEWLLLSAAQTALAALVVCLSLWMNRHTQWKNMEETENEKDTCPDAGA